MFFCDGNYISSFFWVLKKDRLEIFVSVSFMRLKDEPHALYHQSPKGKSTVRSAFFLSEEDGFFVEY